MNRLKLLRKEKHLTLRELASKVNMTNSSISMMENGQRGISNDNVKIFCNFFGCSSDYLLGLSDDRQSPSPQIALHKYEPDISDKLSLDLHKAIDDLNHQQKERTLGYVNGLKENKE